MSLARFHLPPDQWQSESLVLTGEEARHCAQVTRHRVGDEIVVFDGQGRRATVSLVSITKHEVSGRIVSQSQCERSHTSLVLLQGIIKGETMDWIIEKAVELGVQRIVPLTCQRSVVRLDAAEAARKREKWQRVVLQACKQCGQDWLPEVAMPCDAAQAVEASSEDLRLVASLGDNAAPLKNLWNPQHDDGAPVIRSAAVAIGPEGDFTEAEYQSFAASGWRAWSLGRQTLRSETAAVCALSILGYELSDFQLT